MKAKPLALILTATLSTVALGQEVQRTPLRPDHPLVGVWRIDLPEQQCFEEYDVRANGTKLSQSAEERNESDFELSAEPSPKGFYKWSDKITKNNARPDCGGSFTKVGHTAVSFIRLHPSRQKFLLCEAEDMKSCFAEFYRK